MKLFPNNKFLLFCEEQIDDIVGDNIEVVHEPDPLKSLFFMSLCDHFIIANSTMSLMAYYMREQEGAQLVAPRHWSRDVNFKIDDLIRPSDNVKLL
jgi:hypothetical protein